ncbi:MAG: hypothetical protein ABIS69_09445 [Sediminibacterium sp.]
MLTKKTRWLQIFSDRRLTAKDDIERKMDEILLSLSESAISGEEIHALKQYFNDALQQNPAYGSYLATHLTAILKERRTEEIDIVFASARSKNKGFKNGFKKFPNPIRIIISLLIITLGLAMIVMPAPPYFEMYTIFYFNESDGFTLMDLISLLIIFCGIFTLIMTMSKRSRE